MKTCCSCKETLDTDKFYNDKSSKDGKSPRCKKCKDRSKKGKQSIRKAKEKKEKVWTPIPYREHKVTTSEERHEYARRQAAMWI
jgi:hypothetical protein